MKLCSKCKEIKSPDLFPNRSAAKDGKASWCKVCFAAYEKERWHNGDKIRKTANKVKTVAANRIKIKEYLSNHPCVDCGNDDIRVLEFDHRDRMTKVRNISEMHNWSWTTILLEIDKCDVRCANCHRIRTGEQFGFWK